MAKCFATDVAMRVATMDRTSPEVISQVSTTTMPLGYQTGVWYAHVRACDQAGNWGPTRTLRVDFGE